MRDTADRAVFPSTPTAGAVLALAYLLAAKLGLTLALEHPSASAVWPPTGLALAAVVLFGRRLWPGIFLGAFVANVTTAGSVATSLGIAAGNTLEALLGAALAERYADGARAFERPRNILRWTILVGLVATPLSASIGVTSLALGGYAPWADFGTIWRTWWMGDVGGALVVAPILILWGTGGRLSWSRRQVFELGLVVLALLPVSEMMFGVPFSLGARTYPLAFMFYPLLAWAAFRLDPRATAAVMLALSCLSLWGTVEGNGSFVAMSASRNEALVFLQAFLCVTSATSLAVAAAVEERRRAEKHVRLLNEELEQRVDERTAGMARARFLVEAGTILLSSFEKEATLTGLAALSVPRFADWCAVELRAEQGSNVLIAIAHVDPGKRAGVEARLRHEVVSGSDERSAVLRPDFLHAPIVARETVLGALTFGLDPSSRRFTDADLSFAEELSRKAAMAIENAELYRKAQEAVRAREEFLSIASHELRTPLTSLRFQVQIVERSLARALAAGEASAALENVRQSVAILGEDSQRMVRLVGGLLDVTRLATGRLELHREELDLRDAVRSGMDQLRTEMAQRGIEVTVDAPRPVAGEWDRLRLEQVVANLLSNAIKFGEARPIDVRAEASGADALLVVRDRGAGIEPEFRGKIFDRFERGAAREHTAGLGLGLYIVRQIVEAHGGTIRVDSEPGRGATFTVRLPRGTGEKMST